MQLTKEKIANLAKKDPLSFGIFYLDLLESKRWEVSTRAWATEIYRVVNPYVIEKYPVGETRRVVVTKSTQAGISTWAMTRMFHFALNYPVRIFYTLPRQQDVLDFVTTRIDPMIKASPYLSDKLSTPDSAHAKRIGDSYLFFMELSVEPRMMPADALFVDEVDLSNPDYMSTAVNRLDASPWKLSYYLSTPTVPNYGIHGFYEASDKREWHVKCPKCNYEQPLEWEVNLRFKGAPANPTHVYYGCSQCDAEISVEHMQVAGRWVAEHPDNQATIGFHVHQMLTTPAKVLYTIYRDPQTKLVEFYRKRLGKPYEIGGGSIERDDILANCFDEPYEPEAAWDGHSTYFLGADQGNEIQVVVSKIEKDSRRRKIVHVELIPIQKGFDRLAQLMTIFHVKRAVVDGSPNRHSVINLVKQFPGKLLFADYIEQKETFKAKKSLQELPSVLTGVTINRTTGFDNLMDVIKKGVWALPGTPPFLHQETELLIDHVTALKRDVETRRTASGEMEVGVWRKLRAEHLAHAWLYCNTAIDVDKGRSTKVAVIGSGTKTEEETQNNENKPSKETIAAITAILAEVPAEQLTSFRDVLQGVVVAETYQPEFPLSYKISLIPEDTYTDDEILWVVEDLIRQKIKINARNNP